LIARSLASSRRHRHTPQAADVSATWPSKSVAALLQTSESPHNFTA
jgi:hypothetical protein